jgi:hypothetical protein
MQQSFSQSVGVAEIARIIDRGICEIVSRELPAKPNFETADAQITTKWLHARSAPNLIVHHVILAVMFCVAFWFNRRHHLRIASTIKCSACLADDASASSVSSLSFSLLRLLQ